MTAEHTCPPGPIKPPHCHHHGGHHSSSSGASSSSSSSSSANSGSSSAATDSWASDGYNKESYDNASSSNEGILHPGSLAFWMMIAAAGAVATAIAAMVVGSRRKERETYHPLRGAVEKRMKLFGGLADRCFGERELCGADRESVEEMDIVENGGEQYREMA
jgi:hypothetical protein